jgi:hypothetical protein
VAHLGGSHPDLQRSPVCGLCGAGIVGSYVTALDKNWHPQHFLCNSCKAPIVGGFVVNANLAYHRQCHLDLFAPKCFYCDVPMEGEYVRDAWGLVFCPPHTNSLTPCIYCGRLVDGYKLPGRKSEAGVECRICSETSVETLEAAVPLFDRTIQWAAGRNLSFPSVPLHLSNLADLMAKSSEPNGHRKLGTTRVSTTTCNGLITKVEIERIDILRGLPRILFCSVAAHEAGHAWLRSLGVDRLTPPEEEGFCELLAFTWLSEESTQDRTFYAQRIAKNNDAVYGDGFRRLRALSAIHGLAGLVDSLRGIKRLPYA